MHFLNLEQMVTAAEESNMPGFEVYAGMVELLADKLGPALAAHLGIVCVLPTGHLDEGFCGTTTGFVPPDHEPDMPVPHCIGFYDEDSPWVDLNGIAPKEPTVPEVDASEE